MTSSATTPTAQPAKAAGTAEGKLTASRLVPGIRILVTRTSAGTLQPTDRKTGVLVATVQQVARVNGSTRRARLGITTDEGVVTSVSASQTFWLAPEATAKAARKAPAKASRKAAPAPAVDALTHTPAEKAAMTRTAAQASGVSQECAVCGQVKPITSFPTTAPKADGTMGRGKRCRACRDAGKATPAAKAPAKAAKATTARKAPAKAATTRKAPAARKAANGK